MIELPIIHYVAREVAEYRDPLRIMRQDRKLYLHAAWHARHKFHLNFKFNKAGGFNHAKFYLFDINILIDRLR